MVKAKELAKLKKAKSEFNLVGKAKISDFTFKLDVESTKEDSDWVYNQMNLGVDCGESGIIYGEMMSGYGKERKNQIKVYGKKKDEKTNKYQDDFTKEIIVDWKDRFDDEIIEKVADKKLLTVGLIRGEDDKVEYKKFLSGYDAIKYIKDNLEDGMIINVKGNLKYHKYNNVLQTKKEIQSIVLSKCEEKDFRATFVQSILLDQNSIGKPDKELGVVPIDTYVIDYLKEQDGVLLKRNIAFLKSFDFKIGEDIEKTKKMLKAFKTKGKKITQLTVDGYFARGIVDTVTTTENDIPDDIKELIELGLMDKEEVIGKMAFANGANNKQPERMIIKSPHIKFVGEDVRVPMIDKEDDIYTEDDINIDLIIEECKNTSKQEDNVVEKQEDIKVENDIDKALENKVSDDEDDDWLNDL